VKRIAPRSRHGAGRACLQLCALLAASCAGPGSSDPAPPDPAPPDPAPAQSAAERPRPADRRFTAAAQYSASHAGHVFLVLEGEELVYEAGHNGHDPRAPHALHTGTESFWGVLAVAAEQEGLLDLDEPVVDTLREFEADHWRRDMRIRQLLHFTSGLEAGIRALREDPVADRFARALDLEMVSRPGERFQYGPSHLFVFAEILRRKLEAAGRESDPLAYLRQRVLDPIGLAIDDWERDAAGRPDPSSGAHLTARAWARFGLLLRQRGRWRAEAVVEPEALAECFQGSEANPGFGLALWLNARPSRSESHAGWSRRDASHAFYPGGLPELAVATGLDNQRLYVIPSLDLVVVRFGGRDRGFRDEELLTRIVTGTAGATSP
jgi:CubicO group peptidase (beta-lactamase class C family)